MSPHESLESLGSLEGLVNEKKSLLGQDRVNIVSPYHIFGLGARVVKRIIGCVADINVVLYEEMLSLGYAILSCFCHFGTP